MRTARTPFNTRDWVLRTQVGVKKGPEDQGWLNALLQACFRASTDALGYRAAQLEIQEASRRKAHLAMPNADVILMLECSLRFPGVLVRRSDGIIPGADGRATEKVLLLSTPDSGQSGHARTHARKLSSAF